MKPINLFLLTSMLTTASIPKASAQSAAGPQQAAPGNELVVTKRYQQNPWTLTKYMTDDAFGKATQAKSKELFLLDGATHIQTYWQPEYVQQAVSELADFFGKNL